MFTINHCCGYIRHMWCGCLAQLVRVLSTIGAEGMHNWCGGHAPYLGMVKEKDLVNKFLVDELTSCL